MIPVPLPALETAAIIEELYRIGGPRVGCLLVEANVVLTIGGVRGQTEFGVWYPRTEDEQAFAAMNAAALRYGVRIDGKLEEHLTDPQGKPLMMVGFESLRGYERSSLLSDAPGVPPFDRNTGWEGFRAWKQLFIAECKKQVENGAIPFPQEHLPHVWIGVIKGYPWQAIYDLGQRLSEGRDYHPATMSDCFPAAASLYRGAQPGFECAKDHANDPSIVGTIAEWQQVLEGFYQTPWHLKLREDAAFQAARTEREQRRI